MKTMVRALYAMMVAALLVCLLASPSLANGPTTQLAIILDGSGSIGADNFGTIKAGLAEAISGPDACLPNDGTVELSVIQFSDFARLEIEPTVIVAANAANVAGYVEDIEYMNGDTCIACGICLAQHVWLNHNWALPYDASLKQAVNLMTDGVPNECCACQDDCETGAEGDPNSWWCMGSSCSGATAELSAQAARDYALTELAMTTDQDEIDAEFIGEPYGPTNWLRAEIVWPEPGYYFDPPGSPYDGPGWVRVVGSAEEYAETLCEKIELVVEPEVPEEPQFVPEPGSMLLLLSGLLGLAGYAGVRRPRRGR